MSDPSEEDEAALNATRAPLMEHLVELRKRLIWAMVSFGVCFVVCFALSSRIFQFLTVPLHMALKGASNDHLIYTALYEVFFTQVKIAMFGGVCLGFPAIAAQLWIFVAPGLYKHERRAFLPFLAWTPILFIVMAGLCLLCDAAPIDHCSSAATRFRPLPTASASSFRPRSATIWIL